MSVTSLDDLGWQLQPQDHLEPHTHPDHRHPARVVQQGRGAWHVHDGRHTRVARLRSRSTAEPVAGDWVLIQVEDDRDAWIESVLPRRTSLARVVAGPRSEPQVIAANVDLVGICTPADAVNPRRLERELTAVWESGARPVVVVTKTDLVPDPEVVVADVAPVALGVEVIPVTVTTAGGAAPLAGALGPGETMALIGPSGVGKSSLVNALVGEQVLATTDVRADGKGRHTTTSRHLVPLPTGGLLLDTPGMREFAPWASQGALADAFADIDELADGCRFSDCRHDVEPGCAVLAAAENDPAVAERLASWRALQRELAWLERRNDARLMAEERRRWASIMRSARGQIRP